MDATLIALTGLAFLTLIGALFIACFSLLRLARQNILTMQVSRRQIQEMATFAINAMRLNHERLLEITTNAHVAGVLARDGMTPYLQNPSERVMSELRALAENLGVSVEEAKRYVRASIPHPDAFDGPNPLSSTDAEPRSPTVEG